MRIEEKDNLNLLDWMAHFPRKITGYFGPISDTSTISPRSNF